MVGKLYGIGVGPGDPELITLKAVKILENIEVVCVPQAKKGKPSLALNIAAKYLPEEVNVLELVLPMTEEKNELESSWQEAGAQILTYLEKGMDVAFLTLGDPSLYSTFSYVSRVVKSLAPQVEVEVIPGITSYSLAAAKTGVSLAEKDESLLIVPVGSQEELLDGLERKHNVVLMKVSRDFDFILEALEKSNRLENSYFVSRCGQEKEYITKDIKKLKGLKIDYMSLILSKREEKGETK